jgi:hypothetical protein
MVAHLNRPDSESVFLSLSGVFTQSKWENVAPYSLFGDTSGPFYNVAPFPSGSYSIVAFPFSNSVDGQRTVSFSVLWE